MATNDRPAETYRLEVREETHDLTDAEKLVLAGDGKLVCIGNEVSEHYDYEPSCLYIVRNIQKKYARQPQLLESGEARDEKNVLVAAKPPLPIPGGIAGPGLLAHVIVSKATESCRPASPVPSVFRNASDRRFGKGLRSGSAAGPAAAL